MPDIGPAAVEDVRVWVGRMKTGREADHRRFVEWLNGDEAHEIFRRRRLTEYRLSERDGEVMVTFKAPHTGDPRILIDFLRYPGMWPDCWEFVRGGQPEDVPPEDRFGGHEAVVWRRDETGPTTASGGD